MLIISFIIILMLNVGFMKSESEYNADSSAAKVKIILFTASMSCECTLRMCAEYEQAIQKMIKHYEEEIDFEIIDSYADDNLSNKYNISFIPAIIFLDKDNNEFERIVREDDIETKLNNVLKTFLGKI